MSANCDVLVIFLVYGQFGAIRKSVKLVTFYLTKIENRNKKSLAQLSHYCSE